MNVLKRIVQGFDRIVVCKDDFCVPSLFEVHEEFLTRQNMYQKYDGKFHFIVNKNLHNAFPNLKGLLCFVQKKIVLLYKSVGVKAIGFQILPMTGNGDEVQFDLAQDLDFYLEYIGHHPLTLVQNSLHKEVNFSPSLRTGISINVRVDGGLIGQIKNHDHFVFMSPNGPDIYHIPASIRMSAKSSSYLDDGSLALIGQSKKSKREKNRVDVLYVLDDQPRVIPRCFYDPVRGTISSERRIDGREGVPLYRVLLFADKVDKPKYCIKEFYDLPRPCIIELLSANIMHKQSFDEKVRGYGMRYGLKSGTLLVPKKTGPFRIRLLSCDQFEKKRNKLILTDGKVFLPTYLNHNGYSYLLGSEPRNLEKTEGYMVASWGEDPLATEITVTPDFCDLLHKTYGRGFGDRKSCTCFGHNNYYGYRMCMRPYPSPLAKSQEVKYQQYYRERGDGSLAVPRVQQIIRSIVRNTRRANDQMNNPLYMSVRLCNETEDVPMEATTSGILLHSERQSIHLYQPIAFVNEIHVDPRDALAKVVRKKLLASENVRRSKYVTEQLGHGDSSIPTSVGYQFVDYNKDDLTGWAIHQYFSFTGIGVGLRIKHSMALQFMAAALSHNTCLAVCMNKRYMVSANTYNSKQIVVAFGEKIHCLDRAGGEAGHITESMSIHARKRK